MVSIPGINRRWCMLAIWNLLLKQDNFLTLLAYFFGSGIHNHNQAQPKEKGFSSFLLLCGVIQKATLCLFCPLSQSAISSFDLLFTWLSVCKARLFISHCNIRCKHLWSWVCCSGVTEQLSSVIFKVEMYVLIIQF